jgi:hypothetical protein
MARVLKRLGDDRGMAGAVMTEDQARAVLWDFDGIGGLEAWIANQLWQATPDGWTVAEGLKGWRFQLRRVLGGLQVSATAPGGGAPAVWIVSGPAVLTGSGANDDE